MPKIDNSQPAGFDIPGVRFTPIASPSRGSSETGVWRARVEPGHEGVRHHMTREEIIVAVGGEGFVRTERGSEALKPGDAYAVPAFTEFELVAAPDVAFEVMVVLPVGGRAVVGSEPSFVPPWSA